MVHFLNIYVEEEGFENWKWFEKNFWAFGGCYQFFIVKKWNENIANSSEK